MLKILSSQLDDVLAMEWHELGQRIEKQWPIMSQRLYPKHAQLPTDRVTDWVRQTIESCRQWHIDNEEVIITLATDILSAATLRLSQAYIIEMSHFFLASTSEGGDHTAAQDWISRTLFEQYEDQRKRGIRP